MPRYLANDPAAKVRATGQRRRPRRLHFGDIDRDGAIIQSNSFPSFPFPLSGVQSHVSLSLLGDANVRQPSPLYCKERPVTVEEVDAILHSVASKCIFSSPAVRFSQSSDVGSRKDLGRLYLRLSATEAKWFTRLILKTYEPVVLDPMLVYRAYDGRLGMVLKVQEDFNVALDTLQKLRTPQSPGVVRGDLANQIKPILGTKVSRQLWRKGRSLKHCIDMCDGRVSCEKKLDGEYCQVHVDLSKGSRCIQIFSKSGKDSTQDRAGVHQ